jgi:hypothetical protein
MILSGVVASATLHFHEHSRKMISLILAGFSTLAWGVREKKVKKDV